MKLVSPSLFSEQLDSCSAIPIRTMTAARLARSEAFSLSSLIGATTPRVGDGAVTLCWRRSSIRGASRHLSNIQCKSPHSMRHTCGSPVCGPGEVRQPLREGLIVGLPIRGRLRPRLPASNRRICKFEKSSKLTILDANLTAVEMLFSCFVLRQTRVAQRAKTLSFRGWQATPRLVKLVLRRSSKPLVWLMF